MLFDAITLTVACIVLLSLTVWAMRRLVRAQFLRLLAALMRRRMPLEPTLQDLGQSQAAQATEMLAGRVAFNLAENATLPEALVEARVLTPQQAVALSVAQEHGAGDKLLALLAERTTRVERRFLQTAALGLYPLLIGGALSLNALFIAVFIAPRLQDMFGEMNLDLQMSNLLTITAATAVVLFLWGVVAASLQNNWVGTRLWWHVPFFGEHFRMNEQAAFARNLGLMLDAGATLEAALEKVVAAMAGGRLQRWLEPIAQALQTGEEPLRAFRANGKWRPEVLWAMESVAGGAPPGKCLEEVAAVLEDKAALRLNLLHRILTPAAILLAAAGVGAAGWTIFHALTQVQQGMMP